MINKLINKFFPSKKKEFYTWMKGIWEKETDYVLWASDLSRKIKEIKKFNRQPRYEYNQAAQYETRNYCTIYSAITELSYLFDYKFTLCQIKEIGDRMIKDGKLDVNNWAYLSDAIDYTRKWWNENFPEATVSSYSFSYLDKAIWNVKKFIWLTQIWYRTSLQLHNEIQTNGVAKLKTYPKSWWHAVSTYWINIIDNYKWKNTFNRYSFQYMDDLIKNWVIFETGYIFIKD